MSRQICVDVDDGDIAGVVVEGASGFEQSSFFIEQEEEEEEVLEVGLRLV